MQFAHLLSVVNSAKTAIEIDSKIDSFRVIEDPEVPFVAPSFGKVAFAHEKPPVILVSAVGCAGKSTTAREMSRQTGMPLLDLATHPAVGDNTITGLLTTTYSPSVVGSVLSGMASGSFGILIDGLDEGRSKTTAQGFSAFLDNIVTLVRDSPNTSVVVFGRGKVLETVWCYLSEQLEVGLVEMEPFSETQGIEYIDKHLDSQGIDIQASNYIDARSEVFSRLKNSFDGSTESSLAQFLGYPPVLDSIATLLADNKNFHKLLNQLQGTTGEQIEVKILEQIVMFLLTREQEAKAIPNFIQEIAEKSGVPGLAGQLYLPTEQCGRLLKLISGENSEEKRIQDPVLNANYEEKLADWLPEHPFLLGNRFRNPVFEALVVWRCLMSERDEYISLAEEYALNHNLTYHLFLFAHEDSTETMPVSAINAIIRSSSEFLLSRFVATSEIEGSEWQEIESTSEAEASFELRTSRGEPCLEFTKTLIVDPEAKITLGPQVSNLYLTVPCDLSIYSSGDLEFFGDCEIAARDIEISGGTLSVTASNSIVQAASKANIDKSFVETGTNISCRSVIGAVESVCVRDAELKVFAESHKLHYPLVNYASIVSLADLSPDLTEPYRRLRRILLQFKSHSKGQLAKYKQKIQHQRTLGGNVGAVILTRLESSGVLTTNTTHYFIDPARFDECLDISWQQLRLNQSSQKLNAFLTAAVS